MEGMDNKVGGDSTQLMIYSLTELHSFQGLSASHGLVISNFDSEMKQ